MLNTRIDTVQEAIDNARRQVVAMRVDDDSIFSLAELHELISEWERELDALYERGYYGASQAQYIIRRCN